MKPLLRETRTLPPSIYKPDLTSVVGYSAQLVCSDENRTQDIWHGRRARRPMRTTKIIIILDGGWGAENLKQFSRQSTINNMSGGAQAKIRKLNSELKRSRRNLKDQFQKFGFWNVGSCRRELKLLSLMYQLSARKIHLTPLTETKTAEILKTDVIATFTIYNSEDKITPCQLTVSHFSSVNPHFIFKNSSEFPIG